MSNRFARKMHNVKLKKEGKKTVVDYAALEQDPNVHVIECIPLREILATAKVMHVNLFVLDVEVVSRHPFPIVFEHRTTSFDPVTRRALLTIPPS